MRSATTSAAGSSSRWTGRAWSRSRARRSAGGGSRSTCQPEPYRDREAAEMPNDNATYDVLVVGSGLMGAAVARLVREQRPEARILMVDGGPRIGSIPGQHLHDVPEPDIWERYNQRVSSGIQGFYTGTAPTGDVGSTLVDIEPGMYHLSSMGEDSRQMPAAAVAWNVGGMGVHWPPATPTPWGSEVPDVIPDAEWKADLQEAVRLLRVDPEPFPASKPGLAVMRVLGKLLEPVTAPGRGLQHMPMAVRPDGRGVRRRTGPNTIYPPIADPRRDSSFTLLPDTQAVRLLHDGERVLGAHIRHVETGRHDDVKAAVTVVCADAIRTPQLLFASEIRPAALGRYLNEHAFISGRVLTDPGRLGFTLGELSPQGADESMTEHLWVPHSGQAQPFHVQIANQVHIDEDGSPLAYSVGPCFYVPTQVRAENRLEFSEDRPDAAGMPHITVHFSYTEDDR